MITEVQCADVDMVNVAYLSKAAPILRCSDPALIIFADQPEFAAIRAHARIPSVVCPSSATPLVSIGQFVAARRPETLHIVAHGQSGALWLGDRWLTATDLRANAETLRSWQVRRIAIWGCHVGLDREFLELLAEISGARVFASSEIVGFNGLSRNWMLSELGGDSLIDGQQIFDAGYLASTDLALTTLTFVNAYAVDAGVTPAGTETPSVQYTWTSSGLGQATLYDGDNNGTFTGNNVNGSITINGTVYYGSITRPIKVNGKYVGFYFYSDPQWTSINSVPTGGKDDDANISDNRAFILVWDDTYFDGSPLVSGTTDRKAVSSSSDPVSNALNALYASQQAQASITSVEINEASPYSVFTLNNSGPSQTLNKISLTFLSGTAAATAADFTASTPVIEYSLDGTTWTTVAANGSISGVTLGTGANVYIRVKTTLDDTTFENGETFQLDANVGSGAGNTITGFGTIYDDNRGLIYDGSITSGTFNSTTVGRTSDSPVTGVSSPTTTEGGDLVYTVSLNSHGGVTLDLEIGGTASTLDYRSLVFSNGVTYDDATGTLLVPSGLTSFTITAPTLVDGATDDGETLLLSVSGVTGTGTIQDGATAAITVSSPTVNEASPYAVFTVSGTAGQQLNLSLAAGTASAADFGSTAFEVSLDGGATWTPYTSTITLTGATALVRTTVYNDTLLDGGETFTLTATATGGIPAAGTGTILDNGTGVIFNPDGTENFTAPKNDDSITPIYSVLLANGDRYYSKNAADAAKMALGTGNVFEGARFDNLTAAQGGVHRDAYYQSITKDWYFTTSQANTPYACYVLQPPKSGFEVANVGAAGKTEFHMYMNSKGITQILSVAEATALGLSGQGYTDKGAVFSSSTTTAFTFDPEAYLVANKDNAAIQAFVNSLSSSYTSTSDKNFYEAVEQHFLLQGVPAGLQHGTSATAVDLNAAFGTHFFG